MSESRIHFGVNGAAVCKEHRGWFRTTIPEKVTCLNCLRLLSKTKEPT